MFSLLRERGSNEYFQLLNQWHRVCNEEHAHPKSFSAKLLTRVLDLGNVRSIANLRLHEPKGEEGTYVALSHRWGDVQPYCTNWSNLASHCARIEPSELPKTFQDAIVVTYALGIRYLWIDSLCIIQDSEVDWEFECSQMEKVFAGAYCTLAATSAENCKDGFLHRTASDSMKISDSRGHSWVLGDFREDFHHQVEEGKLNRRAWVLQERALSRRVFHFTDSQTYWKCGAGIQCETVDWVDGSVDPFSST